MNEKKKKEKNKKMINVDKKSTKDVKMKRIVKQRFSKKKENFDTMMFEVVNVNNSDAEIFMKYYIDDTTTISSSFTKFFFEFENFLKKKSAAQTHEKKLKKKNSKKNRERELRRSDEKENK